MKHLSKEEYDKVLKSVDWNYQYANGKAYSKGRDSYQKAQRLATTDELKGMFNQRRKEKCG